MDHAKEQCGGEVLIEYIYWVVKYFIVIRKKAACQSAFELT
jgi:hypothetical protein